MSGEVVFLEKCFPADHANERFLPGVEQLLSVKIPFSGKSLCAEKTGQTHF